MADPLSIYLCTSGSEEDERLRAELKAHLLPLAREGLIHILHNELDQARVILLLTSPDFAASRSCIEVDTARALERQARGEARVFRVLLRAHDWTGTVIADLPALPLDGTPAADREDRAGVWLEIARCLRAIQARGYLGIPAPVKEPPTAERGRPSFPREILPRSPFPADEAPFFVPWPRNVRFVGRDAMLETIRTRLWDPARHRASTVGLIGPEGIGKTQLAVEYAHRHRTAYPGGVYWIDAAQGIETSVASLGEQLISALEQQKKRPPGLSMSRHLLRDSSPRGRRIGLAMFLREGPKSLVIVNHVGDTERHAAEHALWPATHELHWLFVLKGEERIPSDLEVPSLPEDDALSLLLSARSEQRSGDVDPAKASVIVQTLGRMPLPLTLAAAYLREHPDLSLHAYRELLAQASVDGAEKADPALHVQCEALSGEAPRRVFLTASLLAPGAEVSRAGLALLTDLAEEPLADAIAELERLALVVPSSPPAIRLHPLVQAFARSLLPDPKAFAEACARRMESALRDMDRLGDAIAERGLNAVLSDLRAGVELDAPIASPALKALLRSLEKAAPALQGWDRNRQLERLLPELCNSAIELGLDDVRDLCQAKLQTIRRSFLRATGHPLLPSLRTLRTPEGRVRALAVTASGKSAVTASDSGVLQVWDLEAGQLLRILEGHTAAVNDVAVTAFQRLIVSASEDGTARVWRLETGELAGTLRGHTSGVTRVAVTPDARLAVSGARDGVVLLWNLETGSALRRLPLPADPAACGVVDIALTPEGRFLIVASGDTIARIWDLESGELAHALVHDGRVERVEVTAGGTSLITIAEECAPRLWDIKSGLCIREFTVAEEANPGGAGVAAVVLTPASEYAVAARRDATIEVWDMRAGRRTRALEGHGSDIVGLSLTPYGQRAVSASADGSLRIWETDAKRELDDGYQMKLRNTRQEQRHFSVTGLALTADGRLAASVNGDEGVLKLWDTSRGRLARVLTGHAGSLGPLAMTPDGRVAVTTARDGSLKVWDLERGHVVRALRGYESGVSGVDVTSDGRFVVSAGASASGREYEYETRVYDLQGESAGRTLEAGPRSYATVCVTPDGRSAVTLGNESMKVWDLESGELVRTIEGRFSHSARVSVTSDSRLALFGSPISPVVVNLETGAINAQGKRESSIAFRSLMAVTADGSFAVAPIQRGSGSSSEAIDLEVWDIRAGRRIAAMAAPAHVMLCAISTDGRSIVIGDGYGSLHFVTWIRPDDHPIEPSPRT